MAFFFFRPSERLTWHKAKFFRQFWYQSVPLVVALFHNVSVFQKLSNILNKATKTKLPYALYRRPLAAAQHHTVPSGNWDEHRYKTLLSYAQHSVAAVSKLSSSSALHFCVSASFNTWTTRSSILHWYCTSKATPTTAVRSCSLSPLLASLSPADALQDLLPWCACTPPLSPRV